MGNVIRVGGNVRNSGNVLTLPENLLGLLEDFLKWHPTPPRDARQLAETTARLRELFAEVTDQLGCGNRHPTNV